MPRKNRAEQVVPGTLTHVISRFVDGRFVLDDDARSRYLQLLAKAVSGSDWIPLSYALMSSHIHLALMAGRTELRSWAHSVHVRFAHWINARLKQTNPRVLGHVFADRPSTYPMCPTRAGLLISYHHRNPIEAGVVDEPSASTWTSHRAYLGLEPSAGGVDVSLGLRLAGFDESSAGRRAFGRFVAHGEVGINDVRPSGRTPDPSPLPSPCSRPSPREIVGVAAAVMGVPTADVFRGSRVRRVATVRRVALAVGLELGRTASEMAHALEISKSAASRLLIRPHDAELVRASSVRVLSALRTDD
jgi:hypothetical protein